MTDKLCLDVVEAFKNLKPFWKNDALTEVIEGEDEYILKFRPIYHTGSFTRCNDGDPVAALIPKKAVGINARVCYVLTCFSALLESVDDYCFEDTDDNILDANTFKNKRETMKAFLDACENLCVTWENAQKKPEIECSCKREEYYNGRRVVGREELNERCRKVAEKLRAALKKPTLWDRIKDFFKRLLP